jgi:hypothetical protein
VGVSPTPEVRDAITRHLYDYEPVNGVKYVSSLIALLGDARAAAGRDSNGRLHSGRRGESWLAAAGYLALLDQVGTSFTLIGAATAKSKKSKQSFHHALRTFSLVRDEQTIEALYALRCALLHDYSLANVSQKKDPQKAAELTHFFRLAADTATPLIQFPSTPWNGDYANITRENETWVNLQKLGDLAEDVVARLRSEHQAGNLDTPLELQEFELRYGLYFAIDSVEG